MSKPAASAGGSSPRWIVVAGKPWREKDFVEALRDDDAMAVAAFLVQVADDLRSGGDTALRLVIAAFGAELRRFLRERYRDDGRAEDALAAGLTRIAKRLSRFDPARGRLRTWLYNESKHAAADFFVADVARPRGKEAEVRWVVGRPPEGPALEEDTWVTAFCRVRSSLHPRAVDICALRWLGFRYREIAARLGLSEANVRQIASKTYRRVAEEARRLGG